MWVGTQISMIIIALQAYISSTILPRLSTSLTYSLQHLPWLENENAFTLKDLVNKYHPIINHIYFSSALRKVKRQNKQLKIYSVIHYALYWLQPPKSGHPAERQRQLQIARTDLCMHIVSTPNQAPAWQHKTHLTMWCSRLLLHSYLGRRWKFGFSVTWILKQSTYVNFTES